MDRLHSDKQGLRGIPTGFPDIDNRLSGLQKSDLIILAARPSMGKTSLALDIARQAAVNHNIPVGIFSLEMSSQQLVDRMLAAQSNVDAWKLRTGKLSRQNDFEAIRESLDKLSGAPIYIDDQPGNNILKMRSIARRLKSEKGLGLIVVDYLQLMRGRHDADNREQEISDISRSLKAMAKELHVPVIALSQLSRMPERREEKRPQLADLRESGAIEQDADVVAFVYREVVYTHCKCPDETKGTTACSCERSKIAKNAEVIVEKQRNGPTGPVKLTFLAEYTSFENQAPGYYAAPPPEWVE